MNKVYIVECFDERDGSHGRGGVLFIALGSAFANKQRAMTCYRKAKKDGLAASIKELPLIGELR